MTDTKRYGLIIPSKKQKPCGGIKRPAAFGNDSSSEEDNDGRSAVNASLRKEATKKTMMKKTQDTLAKAVTEDPTVFEYDSVYDKMQDDKRKSDLRLTAGKSTKPKYIAVLKKTADRRKIEQDIIYERKVQREMEVDNDQFGDKDAFVTSGYKKKLAERKILEAELEKEAATEAANDVTKQQDLGRFYQQLLKQKVSSSSDKDHDSDSKVPAGDSKAPAGDSKVDHNGQASEVPSDSGETIARGEDQRRSPDSVPSKQDV
eukprot:Em0015g1273a